MNKIKTKLNCSNKQVNIYWILFRTSFIMSAFTFGGGYLVLPAMKKYYVDNFELLTQEDLLNIAAIAQSSPGALAVNMSVLACWKLGGLNGSLISCLGTILPPIITLTLVSYFYQLFKDNRYILALLKGMRAGIAACIINILVDMWSSISKDKNKFLLFLAPAAFFGQSHI